MSPIASTAPRPRSLRRVMLSGLAWGPAGGVFAVVVIFVPAAAIPGVPGGRQDGGLVGYAVAAGALWGLLSGAASATAAAVLGKLLAVRRWQPTYGLLAGSAAVSFALTTWFFDQVLAAPLVPSALVGGVAAVYGALIVLATWVAGSPLAYLRARLGRRRPKRA